MSYVLQIFASDEVRSVGQAAELVDGRAAPLKPAPEAFARFRAELESGWPGACDDPALPEGLDPPVDREAVWALAVDSSRAGENLWRHVGRAASRADLNVLDPQAGVLLRRDGMLVDLDGQARALRAPMPWPVKAPPASPLTETEARLVVEQAAARHFVPDGFAAGGVGQWLQFVRETGDVRQCIELTVSESGRDKGSMTLHLGLRFHCPKLRDVWTRHFGEQVAAHVAVKAIRSAPDFSAAADQLEDEPGPLSAALGGRKFADASTREQLVAWVEQVARWYATVGRAVFDRTRTIPGLAHDALNGPQMRWLFLNNNLSIDEVLARLVLAGAFQPERLDEWLAALRDHRRRKGRDPLFGKDLFVPNRAAVFEALAAWVASPDFAPEAGRLRQAA